MRPAARGFTLIEVLIALLILAALALMSYRGLSAVLDSRDYVSAEVQKWQRINAFFTRFGQDVHLAAPRPARSGTENLPAWLGRPGAEAPALEFSRFASVEGLDRPRRVAYHLNQNKQLELWLWSGLDMAADMPAERYPVLDAVEEFTVQYLNEALAWMDGWPVGPTDDPIPRAVRVRLLMVSGEEIVRIFALR